MGLLVHRYAMHRQPQTLRLARTRGAAARRRQRARSCYELGFDRGAIDAARSQAGGCTGSTAASTPSATRSCPPRGPVARRGHGVRRRRRAEPPQRGGALGHPSLRRRQDRRHRPPYKRGSEHGGDRGPPAAATRRRRRRATAIPVTTPGADPRRPRDRRCRAARSRRRARRPRRSRLHVAVDADAPRRRSGSRRRRPARPRLDDRSPLEDAFLELCDRHGIPRPLVNARRRGLRGRLLLARRSG